LFRGFPITGPEDFSDLVEALGIKPLPYVGGAAVRHTVYKDVHTTNESPPDRIIPFHHEMAQVPLYPECLFFYCNQAPPKGNLYDKEVKHHYCVATSSTNASSRDIRISAIISKRRALYTHAQSPRMTIQRLLLAVDG
jgi:hypothetical protein